MKRLIFIMEKTKRKYKLLGCKGLFLCILWTKILYILYKLSTSKFYQWHIIGNYYCRTYKRKAVELVNSLQPEIVVDIGCGLGEIIGRVNGKIKYGIDIDEDAITKAKLLSIFYKKTNFIKGSFEEVLTLPVHNIDVIIVLGLLHGLDASNWIPTLKEIIRKKSVKYILIDRYTEQYLSSLKETEGIYVHYLENHIEGIKEVKIVDDGGEGARVLVLYEVENHG